MPLQDHFHPPLSIERHWESFHAAWIASLADALNRILPEGYFAEERVHAGPSVEIDVATFEGENCGVTGAGTATLAGRAWAPPAPLASVPAVFADDFEVRVFSSRGGPTLVAAIEMVSPANKDRLETRQAFAIKCASYLHEGLGLVVIDVVTDRHANLHHAILDLMPGAHAPRFAEKTHLYAVAYRPVRRDGRAEIDLWPCTLSLQAPLPVLPLALSADVSVPVDLEATYLETCQRRRLTAS
jgi:hypothetical protein